MSTTVNESKSEASRQIVFEPYGPYFIAFVDDVALWVDTREEDGDFHYHEVPPSTKFTLQQLVSTEKFEVVLGKADDDVVAFLVDRADNYSFGLNLTNPSTSTWGICPL